MAITTKPKPKPKPGTRRFWTYEEMVAELPETNLPTELWDGEITMSPAPTPGHQRLVARLWQLLNGFVCRNALGEAFLSPLDVVLSARRTVQPDVLFVAKARSHIVRDCIRGAPDLVMEIVSEGSWRRDRVEKKTLYEQFGVAEYWILDPEASTMEVFVLDRGAYRLHSRGEGNRKAESKLLRGFSLSWSQLAA